MQMSVVSPMFWQKDSRGQEIARQMQNENDLFLYWGIMTAVHFPEMTLG